MKRSSQRNLFTIVFICLVYSEIISNCSPLFIGQPSCLSITNPAMDATTSTINPENVIETKVICTRGRS
uniref:Uncharacterized protein MANES_11G128600 n=1 Tax=Rhizophora mucronata TaxID=61149 RepID=A0A2P2L9G7_RHIMU